MFGLIECRVGLGADVTRHTSGMTFFWLLPPLALRMYALHPAIDRVGSSMSMSMSMVNP